jgi:glutaredoxin
MPPRFAFLLVLACAGAAGAQPLYRWTDDTGRVHITDTPPPASARNIQQKKALAQAVREYPVSLYTAPSCKEPCAAARALLNKRAVPFKDVQVWDEQSNAELKRVSGGNDVPTLVVGRSVHRGYLADGYDALLDAARYPGAGTLPPRAPGPQRN